MKKYYLIYLIITTLILSCNQENAEIRTQASESTIAEIDSLNNAGVKYINQLDSTAIEIFDKAIMLSDKIGYEKGKINALIRKGIYFFNKSDMEQAKKHYQQGLMLAESIADSSDIAKFTGNLALVETYNGNYTKALELQFKTINYYKNNEPEKLAGKLVDIGIVYFHLNEKDKALDYFTKGLDNAEQYKDTNVIATASNNLAVILKGKGNYKDAEKYYRKSLEIVRAKGNRLGEIQALMNIANLLEPKESIKELLNALEIANDLEAMEQQADILDNIGISYAKLQQPQKANQYLTEAFHLTLKLNMPRKEMKLAVKLADNYEDLGNYREAVKYWRIHDELKDSLYNEQMVKEVSEMETVYKTKEKEEQIKLLNAQQENDRLIIQKQRWSLFAISLLILIASVIAYLIFANYRKKQELKKEQELQNQKETERIRIARDMHDEIGAGLTRIVVRSEQIKSHLNVGKELKNGIVESLEKVAEESRTLSHNIGEIIWALNPKNDTLDNLFAYIRNYAYDYLDEVDIACEIKFPENIPAISVSPELRRNVFLIVKEALNNLVKHSKATQANITLQLTENHFSFTVQDNGTGIADTTETSGNGLGNMKKRTETLGGNFVVKSNKGLCLLIEKIPFKNPTKV